VQCATFTSKSTSNTVTVAAKDLFGLDDEDVKMVTSSRLESRAATLHQEKALGSRVSLGQFSYNLV